MELKKICHLLNLMVLLFFLIFFGPYGQLWAGHDEGQQKSKHPDHIIPVAPEPSGLLLFSVGGAIVA